VAQVREAGLRPGDRQEDPGQLLPATCRVLREEVVAVVGAQALVDLWVPLGGVVHLDDDIGGEPEDDSWREHEADAARAEGLRGEEHDDDGAGHADDDVWNGRKGEVWARWGLWALKS
jgi:hypothetical protein